MVFVEVGCPYIYLWVHKQYFLAGVYGKFSCPCSAIIAFTPLGAPQSIFGIWTWLFLHWIVYFKEKRMIVLGVGYKKYIYQAAEFLLLGLILGYIWCMYSRYFKMVANDMIQACTAKL